MNLIAKEFLAVKGDGPGVLVLSEMAGAARELLEALRVNPNAREEVAVALHRALTMPEEEQRRRNAVMKQRLETYDVRSWADRYLRRLAAAEDTSRALAVRTLDSRSRSALVRHFTTSESRLLLLDYDGTLVPFAREPGGAHPDPRILEVLGRLAGDPRTVVAVLSGRDRHTLEAWLGDLPIDLVAEHGGWVRPSGETAWAPALPPEENDWKKDIRPIMDLFVDRIPGSHIEEKVFALVWHYRNADPEIATDASRELLGTLSTYTLNLSIQVLPGTRTVEVRHTGIGKGRSFTRGYAQHPWDFILALGDDWTDEDLFAALPPTAYSIKVGLKTSFARHNVRSLDESRALLEALEATTAVPVG
jgi:trehalose 6-phosphate synthase/phosphatase